MKRLTRDEINKIIELIRKGVSLNRVANKLSRSKSTIYYYYKKLNKRRKLKVDFQNLTDKELGYLVGLFAGDGNLDFRKSNYSYRVVFNFNLKSERKITKKLFTILKKSG
jgi:predicted transcriptional regulator